MTSALLEHLRARTAFEHYLGFDELAPLHVPFDDLTNSSGVESRLTEALGRLERLAVVGASGCGKSSLISHVVLERGSGLFPFVVPLSAVSEDTIFEPPRVADHMIVTLSKALREVGLWSRADEDSALATATDVRAISEARTATAKAGVAAGIFGGDLGRELARQVSIAVNVGPDEKVEILDQVLRTSSQAGLTPVLIFDDTDRWLKVRGFDNPERLVESFFGRILRWVAELECTFVVAAHAHTSQARDQGKLC